MPLRTVGILIFPIKSVLHVEIQRNHLMISCTRKL